MTYAILAWFAVPGASWAQGATTESNGPPVVASGAMVVPPEQQPTLGRWLLEQILREVIPTQYENVKEWGTTKEVFDGWHIKADGMKISTKTKKKTVRHGTWKRYRLQMVAPEEHFRIHVPRIESVGLGKTLADLDLETKVRVDGRLQEWKRDIRLLSTSVEATAHLQLTATVTVQSSFDTSRYPADVLVQPQVESASLRMHSFKLQRVSRADGPIVRELGDIWEPLLDEWLDELNEDLAQRLNRQIAKKKDGFRISISDLRGKAWLDWLAPPSNDSPPGGGQP